MKLKRLERLLMNVADGLGGKSGDTEYKKCAPEYIVLEDK